MKTIRQWHEENGEGDVHIICSSYRPGKPYNEIGRAFNPTQWGLGINWDIDYGYCQWPQSTQLTVTVGPWCWYVRHEKSA